MRLGEALWATVAGQYRVAVSRCARTATKAQGGATQGLRPKWFEMYLSGDSYSMLENVIIGKRTFMEPPTLQNNTAG